MIADTSNVCACCGLFIPFEASTLLTRVHPEFVPAIKAIVIVKDNLDCYKRINNGSHLYKSYYCMIVEEKIPKFESVNCINILPCQKYPDVLSNLTFVEEKFIACTHSIMSIIKLRPTGFDSSAFYHRIRNRMVVLP